MYSDLMVHHTAFTKLIVRFRSDSLSVWVLLALSSRIAFGLHTFAGPLGKLPFPSFTGFAR